MQTPLKLNSTRTIMQNPSKPHRAVVVAVALILNASIALAQAPQPPPPEATDPVKLELMKDFRRCLKKQSSFPRS
jgi:hypothetical protein